MKIESELSPAMTPVWIGFKSFSGTTSDGKTYYVVIPKRTLNGTPHNMKAVIEWE